MLGAQGVQHAHPQDINLFKAHLAGSKLILKRSQCRLQPNLCPHRSMDSSNPHGMAVQESATLSQRVNSVSPCRFASRTYALSHTHIPTPLCARILGCTGNVSPARVQRQASQSQAHHHGNCQQLKQRQTHKAINHTHAHIYTRTHMHARAHIHTCIYTQLK